MGESVRLLEATYFTVLGELYKTDGTETGTQSVHDLRTGTSDNLLPNKAVAVGRQLYFPQLNADLTSSLWVSDGSEAGTFSLFRSSEIHRLTNVNGLLYFVSNTAASGEELWRTDGTVAGTQLVKDIWPGRGSSSPQELLNVNGLLYFSASGAGGQELWISDGSSVGTRRVKDIHPSQNSWPSNLLKTSDSLYFFANDEPGPFGLWKTDGNEAGTVRLVTVNTNNGPLEPMAAIGSKLFFVNSDVANGKELWVSDGTFDGTRILKDITGGEASSDIRFLTGCDNYICFTVQDDLWVSDGTPDGTQKVKDNDVLYQWSSQPSVFSVDGLAYFIVHAPSSPFALWRTDGTIGGTVKLSDVSATTWSFVGWNPAGIEGRLVFSGQNTVAGTELWISDGTSSGTSLQFDFTGDFGSSSVGAVVQADDRAFVFARQEQVGTELFVANINFAPSGTSISSNVIMENRPAGTPVGNLSTWDRNSNDSATYQLVDGMGGASNSLFRIRNGTLETAESLDFESTAVHSIRVRVSDSGGLFSEQVIEVRVADQNEVPSFNFVNTISSLDEESDTSLPVRLADIKIEDDALGINSLSIAGLGSDQFEIRGSSLYLKAGTRLNFEEQSLYRVEIRIDDVAVGNSPDMVRDFQLNIRDVNELPSLLFEDVVLELQENSNTDLPIVLASIVIVDDATGDNRLSLSGSDSEYFELRDQYLSLKPGVELDFEAKSQFNVVVLLKDPSISASAQVTAVYTLNVVDAAEPSVILITNRVSALRDNIRTTNRTRIADIQIDNALVVPDTISLLGRNAAMFEVHESKLWLRQGAVLNGQSAPVLEVRLSVADGFGTEETVNVNVENKTPLIVAPLAQTRSLQPQLAWTRVPGAVSYELWINSISNNVSVVYRANVTGTSDVPSVALGIGKFAFWVRAVDSFGQWSRWTPRYDFSINAAPSIHSMDRFQSSALPVISWTALLGASRYDLWIDNLSTAQSQFVRESSRSVNDMVSSGGTADGHVSSLGAWNYSHRLCCGMVYRH